MYGRLLGIQVLSSAVVVANRLIDNMIIGSLISATAIGSIGIINQAALVPAAFSGVVSMGLYSACSESMGAKAFPLAGKQLSVALALVSVVFLPLIIVLEVFCDPISAVLCANTDAEFIATTSAYFRGLAPSLYLSAVIPYLMYACQMNRKSHWCSVSVGILFATNVGGDLFVATCTDWGMFGIGAATSLSALASMVVLIGPVVSRKSPLHLRWGMSLRDFADVSWRIVSFGLPSAVTTLSNAFAGMWINYLLLSTGDYFAVAAYTCATSVVNMLYMPASPLWYCTSIVTSLMLGKNMRGAIKQLPVAFTQLAVGTTAIPFVIGFIFTEPLCGLFVSSQPEILSLAVMCAHVSLFCMLPNALITCFQSLLRSTEHRIAAVALPAVYLVGFLPLFTWVLAGLFGVPGVNAGRVAAYVMGIVVFVVICCVIKKTSPFDSSTYVFLKPLEEGFAETDCSISRPGQIEKRFAQISGFFAKHGNPESAKLVCKAAAASLEALFAQAPKHAHCWVHAAMKGDQPWIQITGSSKVLSTTLVDTLDFDDVNVTYLDFSVLRALELYTGDAPYGADEDGE